ncbi:MAG: hypothetical protein ACRETQ_13145 [Gammaproteobacteria bacterium]
MRDILGLTVLLGLILVLTGCGGGGGATNTAIMVGPWSGTYSLSGSTTQVSMGAISSEDDGYFADNKGNVYVLSSLPGTSPFTATLVGIAPPGQSFANGQPTVAFGVSGSYGTAVAGGFNMQATFTENDGQGSLSGSFNLNSATPFSGTPNLSSLQGQWSGYYLGSANTSIDLNFGPDGAFAGNDGYGCVINGNLTTDAPNTNLYDVTFQSSGENCQGTLDGLAYESSTDVSGAFGGDSGTYLYIAVFTQTSAFLIEIRS